MSSCGIVKLDGLEDRIVQLPAARVCPMGKGIDMVSACMVANVHVHVHVYAHAHAHVRVHVHVQMHVQMHVNLRMHARAHVTSRASPLKRHARTDLFFTFSTSYAAGQCDGGGHRRLSRAHGLQV